ncbi:tyrosine-type recombinase/integrase [Enterobacter sp. CC120223-11]|uniref:tyrosine-type recombinase/integrase n=1 Tax=Enterobacter sp. CC120223-11 TaxID=1378073 RepID=UPI000BE38A6D|nr:tyrosine-type recombinase/integrase [Enterobacter sp. CC120223-11]
MSFIVTQDRKNHIFPVSKELYESLPDDKKDRLFSDCYGAFRFVQDKTDAELSTGRFPRVLRHTFASHFMLNSGNILVLHRILVHKDIKTTMLYSYFSPDHLEDTLRLNPLAEKK